MRTSATDNGPTDGWRGARIGAEIRDRRHRELTRIRAEVDLGEPDRPYATIAFLALALGATFVEFATFGAAPTTSELGRAGGAGVGTIATGATWKLLTANLLHGNVAHVVMNAFIIYLTGRWLEHLVGRALVVATMLWAVLLTNVGALLVDVPSVGIGASGVAFGLLGCAIAVDPKARTAVGVIARQLAVVNVIATFLVPGISIGGHFGGLLAGLLVGWLGWSRTPTPTRQAGSPRRPTALVAIAIAVPLALLLAVGPGIVPGEAASARSAIVRPLLERQLDDYARDGVRLDDATCVATDDPREYRCEQDDIGFVARYSDRDDQLRFDPGE